MIYDAGGDLVWEKSVPAEQVRANAENYVDWDGRDSEGRDAASGVYFYIVKVNGGKYGKNKIAVLY